MLTRMVLRFVKGAFALFGGYLLVMLYVERWGWAATIWFLGAPLVYGFYRGLMALRTPPTSHPAPR